MDEKKIYKCINVEQLNIVEADGTKKLCLFNSQNIPPLIMDGEDILPGHRQGSGSAGIIFFNTEGDECGGLALSSQKLPDGGYRSDLSMAFDQYKNDQLVQMFISEENQVREYGFKVFDRPNAHLKETVVLMQQAREAKTEEERAQILSPVLSKTAVRMHIGKKADGSVGIRINDSCGRERIRVIVDENDEPHLELYDENGTVIASLTD